MIVHLKYFCAKVDTEKTMLVSDININKETQVQLFNLKNTNKQVQICSEDPEERVRSESEQICDIFQLLEKKLSLENNDDIEDTSYLYSMSYDIILEIAMLFFTNTMELMLDKSLEINYDNIDNSSTLNIMKSIKKLEIIKTVMSFTMFNTKSQYLIKALKDQEESNIINTRIEQINQKIIKLNDKIIKIDKIIQKYYQLIDNKSLSNKEQEQFVSLQAQILLIKYNASSKIAGSCVKYNYIFYVKFDQNIEIYNKYNNNFKEIQLDEEANRQFYGYSTEKSFGQVLDKLNNYKQFRVCSKYNLYKEDSVIELLSNLEDDLRFKVKNLILNIQANIDSIELKLFLILADEERNKRNTLSSANKEYLNQINQLRYWNTVLKARIKDLLINDPQKYQDLSDKIDKYNYEDKMDYCLNELDILINRENFKDIELSDLFAKIEKECKGMSKKQDEKTKLIKEPTEEMDKLSESMDKSIDKLSELMDEVPEEMDEVLEPINKKVKSVVLFNKNVINQEEENNIIIPMNDQNISNNIEDNNSIYQLILFIFQFIGFFNNKKVNQNKYLSIMNSN